MSIGDIYFILFRRKWIILMCSLLGILGAVLLLFVIKPPQYQSQALISIRYVVEGKSLNPPGNQSNTRPLDEQRDSIINTEIATLLSLDLADQVVKAMTPEKILAPVGGGSNTNRAAALVKKGLTVEPIYDSSVIRITFQYPDRKLVQPILSEIVDAYLTKHAQMHEGLGVPNSFLTNETARLRAELSQTGAELRKLKNAAGVISVTDSQKAYTDQISKIRQEIYSSEAELSERQAMLEALTKPAGALPKTNNVARTAKVPSEEVDQYRRICALVAYLEGKEQNYLTQQGYTTENVLVKQVHEQIVQNKILKKSLERKYPGLMALHVPVSGAVVGPLGETPTDLATDSEQILALKAKIRVLNSQLKQVWTEATNFEKVEMTISELEQKRDLVEANLKYFLNNLEEIRIGDALGADKAANISIVQAPSPPAKGWSKSFKKKVAIVAVGGILGGVALAFFIEMFLDRSVKRPTEIENKLRLPLFISIPDMARNGRHRLTAEKRLRLPDASGGQRETVEQSVTDPTVGMDSGSPRHPLRRFYEGLRDRLVVYFEVKNLAHKPKLVGVTSCAKGAGVSSIATGLASALSETGEGNVLLVDMNIEGGAAQHFHKGNLNCGLDSALEAETRENALVHKNLYVATEPPRNDQLPQVLPKRFANLVSKIKSSDFDYIIFDMPPVADTTMTFRLARLMDMTLLVVEAGKTNQEVVKRVTSLLADSKANVSTVLNKTRNYVPRRLHQEFLHDA